MLKSIWSWIKRLTLILWLLFMAFLGAGLAIENDENVIVSLFKVSFPEASLGLVIGVSVLIGAFLGFFTNYLVLKPRLVARKRALEKAKKEVTRLRDLSSRPNHPKE